MEKTCLDVKVNVKPIFCFFAHKYYYEGPCRMTGGDALQPGFDDILNAQIQSGILKGLGFACPEDIATVMEANVVTVSDDWDMKDAYMDELMKEHEQVDVYVTFCSFGADRLWREFGKSCNKPVIISPTIWNPMKSAYYFNNGVETYTPYDWAEVTEYLKAMRARKAIAKANVLLVTRFSETMTFAGADDSFLSLDEVTEKFGTHFRPVNFHEIVDQMEPIREGGNVTTPGRDTPNLTEEEISQLDAFAEELMSEAEECDISKEYLMNSLKAWKVIKKNMDIYDCSACAIPCPDLCSTGRLNKDKFTFCLCHQLNHELGIPSACKYDIAAALTMMAQICLSGQVPYMANTLPIIKGKQGEQWISQIPEEDRKAIADTDNLYCVNMSPAMRKTQGIDGPTDRFAIRHFAYDQKFGAVFHHDFNDDIGRQITLARFSGDCKKLMIVRGEIVKGYGYELQNCSGGYIFRVSDGKKMYKEQVKVGLMLPMVFGDISAELERLAEVMGLETIII
ncbi:MAG: hypothetical protein ACOX75_02590 [Lachnospiraceae bacterium]